MDLPLANRRPAARMGTKYVCMDPVYAVPAVRARAGALLHHADLHRNKVDARSVECSQSDSTQCKELAAGSFTLS